MSENGQIKNIQEVVPEVLGKLWEKSAQEQVRRKEKFQHRVAGVYRKAGKSLFLGTFFGTLSGCVIVGVIFYRHHFCQREEAGKNA